MRNTIKTINGKTYLEEYEGKFQNDDITKTTYYYQNKKIISEVIYDDNELGIYLKYYKIYDIQHFLTEYYKPELLDSIILPFFPDYEFDFYNIEIKTENKENTTYLLYDTITNERKVVLVKRQPKKKIYITDYVYTKTKKGRITTEQYLYNNSPIITKTTTKCFLWKKDESKVKIYFDNIYPLDLLAFQLTEDKEKMTDEELYKRCETHYSEDELKEVFFPLIN